MLRNNYKTNIEEIKIHIKKLLSDGDEHSISEITDYVRKATGKEFSRGEYMSALRDLLATDNAYETVGEGYYRLNREVNSENDTLNSNIKRILDNTISDIYDIVGQNNVLSMSDDELETVRKVREVINYLERFRNAL